MTGNLAELLLTVSQELTDQEKLKWIIEHADKEALAEIVDIIAEEIAKREA